MNYFNGELYQIEDRLKYDLRRKARVLEKIIKFWLKDDKIANKFVEIFEKRLNEVVESPILTTLGLKKSSSQK